MKQIQPAKDWVPQPSRGLFAARSFPVLLVVLVCDVLVLVGYVWLVSLGHWTGWPTASHFYDQLASGFDQGQLSIDVQPSPALLALPNPYDPASRSGISYPQDVSLYNGKFYLYFGPVPGLLVAGLKWVDPAPIGDSYLVFAFVSGLFLVQSLLIARIWRRYFSELPAPFLGLLVLTAGWLCPFVLILSDPSVHAAAVSGGAFFFMAGFLAAFSALSDGQPAIWKMALAGILWAAAIGCRITQIVPVTFLTAWILIGMVWGARPVRPFSRSLPALLALALPLGLGLAALGWYDWARFHSVLETGFSYALAGPDLQTNQRFFYSPVYVLQNIYVYLFNAPKLGSVFPLLSPAKGIRISLVPFIHLPDIYYTQESAGLLYTSPITLMALVPMLGIVLRRRQDPSEGQPAMNWLVVALAGAFLSAFAILTAFFWVAERYVADFLPSLLVLSIIGFWQVDRALATRPGTRSVFRILAVGLIVISLLVNGLLAISIRSDAFRALDPPLWRQLSNFFRQYLP